MLCRRVRILVLVVATHSCLVSSAADDLPTPIGMKDLCTILGKEVGGTWEGTDGSSAGGIESRGLLGKKEHRREPLFLIFYAPCMQDQFCILKRFQGWARPMAIVWAANEWTVIADGDAWMSKEGVVERLTPLLLRYYPDTKSWKTGRQLERLDEEKQRKDKPRTGG